MAGCHNRLGCHGGQSLLTATTILRDAILFPGEMHGASKTNLLALQGVAWCCPSARLRSPGSGFLQRSRCCWRQQMETEVI